MLAPQASEGLPRRSGAAGLHVGQPSLDPFDGFNAIQQRLIGFRVLDDELRFPVDGQDQGMSRLPQAIE
jgi:hypothetical protein